MKTSDKSYISFAGSWLGDVEFTPILFKQSVYDKLNNKTLPKMTSYEKHRFVGKVLLEELQIAKRGSFLLPAVVDFMGAVRESLLPSYTFASFELYLNNYANLSLKEEYLLRGKIVGRHIPRSEYQAFFPVGMGGSYEGSHFSLAHFSPDVDTVIASFHGFLDAFAAKIGTGVHYWQVPLGPPAGSIEIDSLFSKAIGEDVFDTLVNKSRALSLTSLDLFTQKNIVVKRLSDKSVGLDPAREHKSIIVIDENGNYLADWRTVDFDEVRMVINNFALILRVFEKDLYMLAVQFLSKKVNLKTEMDTLLDQSLFSFFNRGGHNLACVERLSDFILKVLKFEGKMQTTIGDFLSSTKSLKEAHNALSDIKEKVDIEDCLNKIHLSFSSYFSYLDTLEVAISVKRHVLNLTPATISHLDDYETIVEKMEGYSHLTVVHEEEEAITPLGAIYAADIKPKSLATLSIRDFSNNDEMDKASYIDVISCIDHHKSDIKTNVPARVITSDAQSSNSIIARINIDINNKYSVAGYTKEGIESQIKDVSSVDSAVNMRLLKRLLTKKEAVLNGDIYFISKDKEFLDYYHFLFAILDDTDLLTKVTPYDVYVVRDLLNKMKSLMVNKEVEVVQFDDLDPSELSFTASAASRLLQSHDLYSLYSSNYQMKEKNIENIIKKATGASEELFFQDTKILGKYAQIGQFKLFRSNHTTYKKRREQIQKHFLHRCEEAAAAYEGLSLFIFMVSTVDSAEELFSGAPETPSKDKDELWITHIDGSRQSYEKAKRFITGFFKSPKMLTQNAEVHLQGDLTGTQSSIGKIFPNLTINVAGKSKQSLAEIHVELKSIKSRKADIAPYI